MDSQEAVRALIAAFGMGTIGVVPVDANETERRTGRDGTVATESLARYVHAVRTLLGLAEAHPELNVRADLEKTINALREGGNPAAAFAAIEAMLARARAYLPE